MKVEYTSHELLEILSREFFRQNLEVGRSKFEMKAAIKNGRFIGVVLEATPTLQVVKG